MIFKKMNFSKLLFIIYSVNIIFSYYFVKKHFEKIFIQSFVIFEK